METTEVEAEKSSITLPAACERDRLLRGYGESESVAIRRRVKDLSIRASWVAKTDSLKVDTSIERAWTCAVSAKWIIRVKWFVQHFKDSSCSN